MATPTYLELWQASQDGTFFNKCSIAVAKYAQFIIGENPATSNHTTRYRWAASAVYSPQNEATRLMPSIVLDPGIANQNPLNLAGTTDATIQTIVESCINNTILKF